MRPWKVNSSSFSAADSQIARSKQLSLQLVAKDKSVEKKNGEFWWLNALSCDLMAYFLSTSATASSRDEHQQQKITLVVCPENNIASFVAESFCSNSGACSNQILFATLVSVIRSKVVSEEFSKKFHLRQEKKMESEYMSLLRLAAANRAMSVGAAGTSLVVITTVEALASRSRALLSSSAATNESDAKRNAEAVAASLSSLCSGCNLICLPGVDREFAEACQSMTSQLIYLSAAPSASSAAQTQTGKLTFAVPAVSSASEIFVPHPELLPQGNLSWHLDDEASTHLLCCNNVPGFLKRLRVLHDGDHENIEFVLSATLLAAWCSSSTFALHVRFAHIFRHLLDRAGSIDKETGEMMGTETSAHATLRVQASRAIAFVASKAEPLTCESCEALIKPMVPRTAKTGPFLFRAVCSFALGVAPSAALDTLCAAWGVVDHIVAGTTSCKQAKRKQGSMIHAIRMRYASRHGDGEVGFVEFVCHMLIDQVSKMAAVTVGEVRSWLLWDVFFGPIFGKLTAFLKLIGVLPASSKREDIAAGVHSKSSNNNAAISKNKSNNYQYDEELLRPFDDPSDDKLLLLIPRFYKTSPLNTKQLPLHTAHERKEKMLHDSACEEVLSAMPQKRIPMYIGDVGNLIGKWTKFNNKYEGRLGTTLTDFLLEHPEKFRVVSNVVIRVTESAHEPVRVRFDNAEWDGDDSDNDGNEFSNGVSRKQLSKKQKREDEEIAKSGGKQKHTQRSRKKALKSARNRQRYDRNRKQLAQDAKVPGYSKPLPKKLSGRGKKANARTWKR